MSVVQRFLPIAVILALVGGGVWWMLGSGGDTKTVTAYFPRTVSVYEGSDVRVLGVPVGTVEEVVPEGTRVKVVMHYDAEVQLPEDVEAVIVSPSVVGDRYIQLTPVYERGPVLADNTVLEGERTQVPLELDEIFQSFDRMVVALGPRGANSEGALTDLLEQTARNFGGQGAQFKQTIRDFARFSSTLEDNKEELFSSVEQLERFISTLAENDTTVRRFNRSLGNVSELLDSEREELASALHYLGIALDQVNGFVRENRESLGRNIRGLARLTRIFANRREDINGILRAAPLAYNNLGLGYNPQTGTLDANANMGENINRLIEDPTASLCAILSATSPELCDLIEPLPRTVPFGTGPRVGATYDPTLNGLVGVE